MTLLEVLTSPIWPIQKLTYMKFVVSRFLFRPYSPRSNNAIYPAPLMCQCGRAMDRKMWRLKRFWDTFLGRGKDRSFYLPVVFHIRCYERGELRFDFDHLIRLWQHHANGRTDGQTVTASVFMNRNNRNKWSHRALCGMASTVRYQQVEILRNIDDKDVL